LKGIFVASYDVSDFTDFYQKLPLSRSGVVALSGMDGINRIRTARETSFGTDVSDSDVFSSVLAMGDARFSGKSSFDGGKLVGFHARSHIYPFYIFVGRYSDDIRRETSRFQTILIALGLLIASLAVAALWSVLRYAQSETMRRQSETLLSARQRESDILSTLGRVPNIYVADIAGGAGGDINVRSAPPKDTPRPRSREAVTRHIRANTARILGRTGPGPQISYERFRHENDDYELLVVAGEILPLPLGRKTGRTIKPDYAIVAIDQSDKRTEEQKLFQLSKLAALGEMTTGLAHEINQPLTIIRMIVENALDPAGQSIADAHLAKKMRTIDAQAERMQRIIEHMRIFGREPQGRKSVVAFGDLASGAMQMVSTQYRLQNIVIDEQLDGAGTMPVRVQAIQIEQVILNVLRNAREAILERRATGQETLEGRIEVRAVVEVQPPSRPGDVPMDGVSLVVSDNGTGIGPGHIDRILEPFFTTKPPNKGTGLGLSVSHGIVRDHGGSIRAENGPDGAVITIWLPIIQADQGARPEPGPGDTADNPSRRKFRARAVPCCGHKRTTRDNDDGEDHD
jgi:C4-dicarboxylate-specific signal transduction histidine kinase